MDIHILFPLVIALGLPLGCFLCTVSERARNIAFFLMVFSTALFARTSIYYFRDDFMQRATPGLEIQLADLCGIMLVIGLAMRSKLQRVLPLTIPYSLYLIGAVLAWLATESGFYYYNSFSGTMFYNVRLYPILEILKIVRAYFLMWVTVQYLQNDKAFKVLYAALIAAVSVVSLDAIFQRYIEHAHRCSATFAGPNDFACYAGMISIFFLPFAFTKKAWIAAVSAFFVFLLGLVGDILSISRACVAVHLLLSVVMMSVCFFYYRTVKNAIFCVLCVFALFGVVCKSYSTLAERMFTAESVEAGRAVREPFFKEISMMMQDHPLGVGMGNFGVYSIVKYAEKAGADAGLRAHNIWYLTFAETGYVGLMGFLLLWIRFFQMCLSLLFRRSIIRTPHLFAMVAGILGAMVMCHFQNWFHFCYQYGPIFFLSHILMGLLCRIYLDSKVPVATRCLCPVRY